jgi:hypothetical protein
MDYEVLSKSRENYDHYTKQIENRLTIEDKTMDDWATHFAVKIAPDLVPCQAKEVLSIINDHYEEAGRLYRSIITRQAAIEMIYKQEFSKKFVEVMNGYKDSDKRKPSKEAMEHIVNLSITEISGTLDRCSIVATFFKQIIDKLTMQRKIVENIIIALGIEAKIK